jgi:HK97 family phage prohead protease
MLTKNLSFEFKADSDKRTFEGYASTWDLDLGMDQIEKGAFKKTIAERFPVNGIKILWQHDYTKPIGLPVRMEEDSKGLYIEGRISKTELGNEALELMKDGVVDKMSIGYDVVKDDISEDGQKRFLKELTLYEFSPVTFPMNTGADILSVKTHINSLIKEFNHPQLAQYFKEGRALNKQNVQALKSAIDTLQNILTQVEVNEPKKQLSLIEQSFSEIKAYSEGKKDAQDDFISACMSRLHERYPDQDQRLAICFSEWEDQ